jgi:hypothetical protein
MMIACGFVRHNQKTTPNQIYFITYGSRRLGHIGIVSEGLVYHQTRFGVKIEVLQDVVRCNSSEWVYLGD